MRRVHITLSWLQCAVGRAFRKLSPLEWLEGIAPPCLEDLINRQVLCAWRDWSVGDNVTIAYLTQMFIVSDGLPRLSVHSEGLCI